MKSDTPSERNTLRRGPVSSTFSPTDDQARLLADSIERLQRDALIAFRVREARHLDVDDVERFLELPEYDRFILTCRATGFVCSDLTPAVDLDRVDDSPQDHVPAWSVNDIRQYMHTLIRAERWAEGMGSPVLRALSSGALELVSVCLRRFADEV